MRQGDWRGPPYGRGPPFGRGGGGGPPFRGSNDFRDPRDRPPGPESFPNRNIGHVGGLGGGLGAANQPVVIDRTKTCPLLLRVFVKPGAHHRIEDFAKRGQEPDGCIHVYTWMDATLGELTELVQEVNDDARKPRTRLSFAFIYPDRRGRNVMRQVGMVMVGRPSIDDDKTLAQLQFQTGDLLDVALL